MEVQWRFSGGSLEGIMEFSWNLPTAPKGDYFVHDGAVGCFASANHISVVPFGVGRLLSLSVPWIEMSSMFMNCSWGSPQKVSP